MMQYRNAAYNKDGTIDCELQHPQFGWIPFTASPADTETLGRDLYQSIIESGEEIAAYEPPSPEELLAAAQARQILAINDAYSQAVAPLIKDYPSPEPLSWAHQDAEAQAYLAWHAAGEQGDPPATPVLDRILAGRNGDDGTETMLELCQAVERNAEMFRQAQELTGLRQRLVKAVRAAKTVEQVKAVVWPVPEEERADA